MSQHQKNGSDRETDLEVEHLLSSITPAEGFKTILPDGELFALWGDPANMDEKEWRRMSLRLLVGNIRTAERAEGKAEGAIRTSVETKQRVSEVLRRQSVSAARSAKNGEEIASLRADVLEVMLNLSTRDAAKSDHSQLRADIAHAKKMAQEAKEEVEEVSGWKETTGQFSTAILQNATDMVKANHDHEREMEKLRRKNNLKLLLAVVSAGVTIAVAVATAILR